MIVKKNYKFRLSPKGGNLNRLQETLNTCRYVYNQLLEKRNNHYKETKKTLSCFDCNKLIGNIELKTKVHSQVLQNVSSRVDLAYLGFFRRLKDKTGKAGFPRFRSYDRYDSFTFPQTGFKIGKKKLWMSRIGDVRINFHRPMEGKAKTLTIKREGTHWYAIFSCEIDITPETNKGWKRAVGVDVGCIDFATLSNGETVKNPHFLRQSQEKLSNIQSKYSKLKLKPREDKQKIKAKRQLITVHCKIKNQRKDFLHKLSKKLVTEYSHICVENIKPSQMLNDNWRSLNKSIMDSGWTAFRTMLHSKAVEAGCEVVDVNPAYTSQTCSGCGNVEKKELSERQHKCNVCGLDIGRDLNAARNILRVGMDSSVRRNSNSEAQLL
jgi:putative transposase